MSTTNEKSSRGFWDPHQVLSNLGMSEGNLTGMVDHEGSWWIGLLINLERYGISKVARNGNC